MKRLILVLNLISSCMCSDFGIRNNNMSAMNINTNSISAGSISYNPYNDISYSRHYNGIQNSQNVNMNYNLSRLNVNMLPNYENEDSDLNDRLIECYCERQDSNDESKVLLMNKETRENINRLNMLANKMSEQKEILQKRIEDNKVIVDKIKGFLEELLYSDFLSKNQQIKEKINKILKQNTLNLSNDDSNHIKNSNANLFWRSFGKDAKERALNFDKFLDELSDDNNCNGNYHDNDMIKNESHFSFLKDIIDRSTFLTLHLGCENDYLRKCLCKQADINNNYVVFKCCDNNVFQKEHINLLQNFLMNDLKLNVNVDYSVYNTNVLVLTKGN